MSVQAKAKVRLIVEVSLSQPWGDSASVGEVFKVAGRQATEVLRRALAVNNPEESIQLIGTPAVICVTAEEKGLV